MSFILTSGLDFLSLAHGTLKGPTLIAKNHVYEVIYQTRGRVFHPISKHREVVEKTRRSRVFFNQLQGVWISDETPFRMFDIASQTINNSWRKSKQKVTRCYDN